MISSAFRRSGDVPQPHRLPAPERAPVAFCRRGAFALFNGQLDIGCFPVGIEPSEFASSHHPAQIESSEPSRIIGIDRLDYTKGLPQKFRAFGKLLEDYPEYRRRIVLSQFAPPRRESVEAYADIKSELESLSGSINGRYGELDER